MAKRIPWGELPRVAVFEITRQARSSEKKSGPFHFPPIDIPERSVSVWALDSAPGAWQEAADREERFQKAFKGVARGASGGYGAAAEGTAWASYLSSKTLSVLPLDDEGLSPEQIIAKEEQDWTEIRQGVERWAAREFPSGSYRVSAPESKSRFEESEGMLQELAGLRQALKEAQEIESGVNAGAPGRAAPSI